jgi:hypothetical protein
MQVEDKIFENSSNEGRKVLEDGENILLEGVKRDSAFCV